MFKPNFKSQFFFLIFVFTLFFSACAKNDEIQVKKEFLGNPEANLELQVYSDLECPACSKASEFLDVLLEKYGDKIKITYHHFPLESIHPHAFEAAVAAECAGEQGALWKYIKYAYKFQNQLDRDSLKKHALNLGLETEKFNLCLENNATAEIVAADLNDSLRKGLKGTPSFALNGQMLKFGVTQAEIMQSVKEALGEQ